MAQIFSSNGYDFQENYVWNIHKDNFECCVGMNKYLIKDIYTDNDQFILQLSIFHGSNGKEVLVKLIPKHLFSDNILHNIHKDLHFVNVKFELFSEDSNLSYSKIINYKFDETVWSLL